MCLFLRHVSAVCAGILTVTVVAVAQPTDRPKGVDRYVEQLVDSRRGYLMRIPAEARIDSASSGWSPTGKYERRVYRIPKAGSIVLTVTIRHQTISDSAKQVGPYRLIDADSATATGTARVRLFLLPTRDVRIELIPAGVRMREYLEASEKIFGTFRWKPGAETDALDLAPPDVNDIPGAREPPKTDLGGS